MITIGTKKIGDGCSCFIIAEAGVNHNGDFFLAKKLIDAASESGADAIKFQTFSAKDLVTASAEKADYQKKNDSSSKTQIDMLKNLELSRNSFKKLSEYAKTKDIIFLSTAFDQDSIDLLTQLQVPAFKIPSGEITNFPYLENIAQKRKPVILSTGMSTMEEVREAVDCLQQNGCRDIILLHCTTSYPAPLDSVNLKVLETLRDTFHLPVGYSDHTEGIIVPLAAVARGACIIEKHVTLDKHLPGPDHAASLEPDEFKEMVMAIRKIDLILGTGEKAPHTCEKNNRTLVRRSIVASHDIPKGTSLSESMLALKRPGTGIEPKALKNFIGKTTKQNIKRDTLISWDMVE
ncbi:MAG: N-acetylneuraminate synthase [Methanoregula sp.]